MAKPSDKSPEVDSFLDEATRQLFGSTRRECIRYDTCVICGKQATKFSDELSRKEYSISGMCQACQDETFTGGLTS
jgi:hypothetical protein